jgi:hypothetical protein
METKNQSYSDIAKVFESFLGNSKNAGILYPKNVDSIQQFRTKLILK